MGEFLKQTTTLQDVLVAHGNIQKVHRPNTCTFGPCEISQIEKKRFFEPICLLGFFEDFSTILSDVR